MTKLSIGLQAVFNFVVMEPNWGLGCNFCLTMICDPLLNRVRPFELFALEYGITTITRTGVRSLEFNILCFGFKVL